MNNYFTVFDSKLIKIIKIKMEELVENLMRTSFAQVNDKGSMD